MSQFVADPETDTICRVIARWGEVQPEATALISHDGILLTYAALAAKMRAVSREIVISGFHRGDRIGIVHRGGPDLVAWILGVMSKCTAVPLNPSFTNEEFLKSFEERGVTGVVCEPGLSDNAIAAARSKSIHVLNTNTLDTGNQYSQLNASEMQAEGDNWNSSLLNEIAIVWGTSSTTAQSKIIPSTHKRLLAHAAVEARVFGVTPRDVGVAIRHLHYSGPFNNVLGALYSGGSIVVLPSFEPEEFVRCLSAYGVTWYAGGPTFHRAIHAYLSENPEAVQEIKLRFMRASSGYLEPKVADDLEKILSAPHETNYSCSEAGRIAFSCQSIAPRKRGAVGVPGERLGLDHGAVRIRSLEGVFLQVGERGEIVVRGDQVFEGYENAPELTEQAFIDGWFRTGDEGFFDEDGYLHLTGRIKEMINRGGEKVSPAEVDSALMEHPDVVEAATFPLKHPTLGEEVAAAVVQAPGGSTHRPDSD